MADGWLWSFSPLARITPDGAWCRELPAVDTDNGNYYVEGAVAYTRALQYLPLRRALLLGQRNSIWYLQLPKEPDPPPPGRQPAGPFENVVRGGSGPCFIEPSADSPLPARFINTR